MTQSGRTIVNESGTVTGRHHIDPERGVGHLKEDERAQAIVDAHSYRDAIAAGRRFNLMHGARALPKDARDKLTSMGESERNAVLDLSDHRDHAPILARLAEMVGVPKAASEPTNAAEE